MMQAGSDHENFLLKFLLLMLGFTVLRGLCLWRRRR